MRLTFSEFDALNDYHDYQFPVLEEDSKDLTPVSVASKIKDEKDTDEKLYQLAIAIDALSKRLTASSALLTSVSEKIKTI